MSEIVNKYELEDLHFSMLIDEAVDDSALDQHLTGELYWDLIKMRIWYEKDKEKYNGILGLGFIYDQLLIDKDEEE